MNKKSITKDELYLVKLLEIAKAKGDAFQEVDRYAVGRAMGQNDKSIDNIVRMLAQTNFIKKGDESSVYLTEQGVCYIDTLTVRK